MTYDPFGNEINENDMKENKQLLDSIKDESNRQKPFEVHQEEYERNKYLESLKAKSSAMKENIPESPEKGKPFLTEEELLRLVHHIEKLWSNDVEYVNDKVEDAIKKFFNAAAEKANPKVKELEKVVHRKDKEIKTLTEENAQLKNSNERVFKRNAEVEIRISELEKERDKFAIEFAEHCFKESMRRGISIDFELEKFKSTHK